MRHYTVSIPTAPYIKAFVSKYYGDPLPINNQTTIGAFLIGVMSKKTQQVGSSPQKKDTRFNFFVDAITCIAPWSQMNNYGYYLTQNHIIQINRYLESLFDEQLFFWIDRRINKEKRYAGYTHALEAFISYYNMPENVGVELLKKREYRYREKTQKKSIATLPPRQNCRQNPLFA